MRQFLSLLLLLAVAACDVPSPPTNESKAKQMGPPRIVAQVEGVTLWAAWDAKEWRWVYFSSRGDVAWDQRVGKHTEYFQVPAAN